MVVSYKRKKKISINFILLIQIKSLWSKPQFQTINKSMTHKLPHEKKSKTYVYLILQFQKYSTTFYEFSIDQKFKMLV